MRTVTLAALSLLLAAPTFAQEVRSPEHGFRYQVPDGWYPVLQAEVEALDAYLSAQLKEKKQFTYVMSFSHKPGGKMQFPYVLFQVQQAGFRGASVEDVQNAFGTVGEAIREADEKLIELSEASAEAPRLDLPRRRVLLGNRSVVDGTPVRSVSSMLLGNDRTLTLHCYAEEAAFEATLPVCRQWFEHFKLDPEQVWEPVGGTGRFVGIARCALQGALIGGIAAVVLAVLGMMRRRKKDGVDQTPPADPGAPA
jgi:hypothetical protein